MLTDVKTFFRDTKKKRKKTAPFKDCTGIRGAVEQLTVGAGGAVGTQLGPPDCSPFFPIGTPVSRLAGTAI